MATTTIPIDYNTIVLIIGIIVFSIFGLYLGGYNIIDMLGLSRRAIDVDKTGLKVITPPPEAPKVLDVDGIPHAIGPVKTKNSANGSRIREIELTDVNGTRVTPPLLVQKGEIGLNEDALDATLGSNVTFLRYIKGGKGTWESKKIAELESVVRNYEIQFAEMMSVMTKLHMSKDLRDKLSKMAEGMNNREQYRKGYGTEADNSSNINPAFANFGGGKIG